MSEMMIRLMVFSSIFLAMAALEFYAPRRELRQSRSRRWRTNWAIFALDILAVRLVFPMAAVGIALFAHDHNLGLSNWTLIETQAAPWIVFVAGFLILDFGVWATHWLSHKVPALWRVHKIHHADLDMDVTTALRFHPVEILLSMGFKALVIIVFGIPAEAVLVFEIVLNGGAMFNHANIRLPLALDRNLRRFIVTPDMHRVHHSVHEGESNTNFGFNLSVWDQIFATYTANPKDGHRKMRIGLDAHQEEGPTRLWWSLALPFRRDV